ncbi:YceH family protein [Rubrolithibacter danxiaensis]|uniref:YceH family protein n=1 Tax=Rubrolithibacter danxiaensis TaxID=3390805 RepID=UPI003BF91084
MNLSESLPVLDAVEQRVLGALMEKSKTTPEYYPMTINALIAACNQKTSRKPVVQYDEETVALALNSLKKKGLISTATGGSSRAVKYKHNFAIVYPVAPAEVAIICLLLLRGPLTPGELNTNSGRLYEFESIEEVQQNLEKLAEANPPFVMQLQKRPGQKEVRFIHLLGEVSDLTEEENSPTETSSKGDIAALESRLTQVETELAEMKEAFNKLMKELMG